MGHPAIQAGRTAVITGGASGIGYAVAQKLIAVGMNVVIADRDQRALKEAANQLGENALAVLTDVANLSDVEALRDTVLSRFGEVAVLMNNAGTGGGGGAFGSYKGWQKVLGVNLWGVVAANT